MVTAKIPVRSSARLTPDESKNWWLIGGNISLGFFCIFSTRSYACHHWNCTFTKHKQSPCLILSEISLQLLIWDGPARFQNHRSIGPSWVTWLSFPSLTTVNGKSFYQLKYCRTILICWTSCVLGSSKNFVDDRHTGWWHHVLFSEFSANQPGIAHTSSLMFPVNYWLSSC